MTAIQEPKPQTISSPHIPLHAEIAAPQGHSAHEPELKRSAKIYSKGMIFGTLLVALAALGGLFLVGWIPRHHLTQQLAAESHRIQTALPTVRVMSPRASTPVAEVLLPGDVQAMEEITIYPRTTGYIKRWLVDIGDEVQAGQLLAEIDIPEVKAQLQQSQATLAESKANLERARATASLAGITTNRLRTLVAKKTVAQQELDDAESNLAVAEANVRLGEATIESNAANVNHAQELLSFSEIYTPFSGTVTARHVDTGKLVTSGNGTGQALFQLARTNPVRVFINVPQIYASGVSKGLRAEIVTREHPGRVFHGEVTRTARAIDSLTRTLLTEIQVPNDDHALLTGAYVQVRMEVERQNPPLLVPASALVFNASGTRVAVVGSDNKIQLRQIEIAGDFGPEIGVATGVTSEDKVVINPGDRLSEGVEVEIEAPPSSSTPAPIKA